MSKIFKNKELRKVKDNVKNSSNGLKNVNRKQLQSKKEVTNLGEIEYTVGSISDLITGKDTPNRSKIVKLILPKPREIQPQQQLKSSDVKTIKEKIRKRKSNIKNQKPSQNNQDILVIHHNNLIEDSIVNINEDNEFTVDKLTQNESKALSKEQLNAQIEANSRTVFVGNVSVTITKYHINKLFGKYGKIQSVRLRDVAPSTPLLTKRVAAIKKLFHAKRTTLNAYVVFEKREDAIKALALNGFKYKEHYLRVGLCDDFKKPEKNKAIFLGNLSFEAEDDDLWSAFESCGPIKSVRIIRNSVNGVGLGIGYVNFEFADSVELALQLDEVKIKRKVVRIKRYQEQKSKKNRQDLNLTVKSKENKQQKGKAVKHNVPQQTGKKNMYRGKKALKNKKKPKFNRDVINKMKISQKIAPRSKNF